MSPATPPAGWRERADRAVRRGQRLDRFIPGFLLDSAISRTGYLYATGVAWVWGGLLSTGRIERKQGLWVFRGLPPWAFPRGGVCTGGCFLTGDGPVPASVLRHEAIHRRQWQKYGMLMPLLYAIAGRDPLRNRFEIEAGLEDGRYVPRQRVVRATAS
ncbi:Fe-S oxidoreductase [Microbacterium sp. BR1]|uniref:Fe-S oxidoreductase n=1 Tax=Microbacterium sp. BR1 TaxID=1070896 RepID=UPI000C2CB0D8|nr:Fe-S oxidoreductase [Microbacterium sp. BR1]